MIRVLHVIHGMNCGGTENIIMNLYRNIDRKKVQFDFLVHTEKDCFFDEEIKSLGGKIYRVPYYNMLNLFTYRRALNRLFSSHNEWTVVHGHLGSCACIYLKIAKKYNIYTIAHSHNLKKDKVNIKELLYRVHAYLARGVADYYLGCSMRAGIDRFGEKIVNSTRFSVMNNSIDTRRYIYNVQDRNRIRKEFGIRDEFVVGNVARFNPQKNHKFLLKVFAEFQKRYPSSKLLLVGDGELSNAPRCSTLLLADSGLPECIRQTALPSVRGPDRAPRLCRGCCWLATLSLLVLQQPLQKVFSLSQAHPLFKLYRVAFFAGFYEFQRQVGGEFAG